MSDAKIAIKAAGDSSQKAFEQFDGFLDRLQIQVKVFGTQLTN